MTFTDKFFTICKRYGYYVEKHNTEYLEEILVKHVMLKAYEKHSKIDFNIFVKECVADPINYLYSLSEELEMDYYELHLLNNCFNDKSAVHYGLKVENTWYFITHYKNAFSLPLYVTEFKIKPQDLENISYLTSLTNVAPNIIRYNVGQIKKRAIMEYNNLFLKKI
jgi:hypothetical protein